jgi:uncharacterized protein YbjQ (UPF0145 family)
VQELAGWIPFLVLLLVTFAIGEVVERRHYRSIRRREERWREIPLTTFREVPRAWEVQGCTLVVASTVVSVDYFKRFLAGLRAITGGRVRSYESLLDRARREALLRVKKAAIDAGCHAVINLRLETSNLSSPQGKQGVAGVEIVAFGTGLRLARRPV